MCSAIPLFPFPTPSLGKIDQIITTFIWAVSTPKITQTTLQLPLCFEGLALPCFKHYYWAAVMLTVRYWFAQSHTNPLVNLEATILRSYSALSNLVFRGPRAHSEMTTSMQTTCKCGENFLAKLNKANTISPYTPLWGNPTS